MAAEKSIRNVVALDLTVFDGEALSLVGLNLQAIIKLKQLSSEIIDQLKQTTNRFDHYSQLLLIGHGGNLLWQNVKRWQQINQSKHPIDDFSILNVEEFLSKKLSSDDFEIVFPISNKPYVNLQALGKIAGWHYPSPFALGVNQQWGSWFAYRAVVLLNSHYVTQFPMTETDNSPSPCESCITRNCIQSCPVDALAGDSLDLSRCLSYRKQSNSDCKDRCVARMVCPVAKSHQYSLEQIQYHYGRSMQIIGGE